MPDRCRAENRKRRKFVSSRCAVGRTVARRLPMRLWFWTRRRVRRACRAGHGAREAVDLRLRYRHVRANRRRRVRRHAQRRRSGIALSLPLVAFARVALAARRRNAQRAPLQLVQAAATVACAPLVAALARPYAEERLAERLGSAHAALSAAARAGVRRVSRTRTLHAARCWRSFLAADRGRWVWFAICAIVAIGLREDAALTLVVFGIVLLAIAARSRPRNGRGLLDGSPPRRGARRRRRGARASVRRRRSPSTTASSRRALADGLRATFTSIPSPTVRSRLSLAPFAHPLQFVRGNLYLGRLTYVLEALVPLAFLPLRSRGRCSRFRARRSCCSRTRATFGAWAITTPRSGFRGCSSRAIAGVASLARRPANASLAGWLDDGGRHLRVFLIAFDPMHPLHYLHPYYHDLADARRAIGCVPKDASLATYDEWFSAVAAQRPRATIDRTSGVRVSRLCQRFRQRSESGAPAAGNRLPETARGEYRVVCRYGDVLTYEANRCADKIPGPSRLETLRGLLPVPFRRFPEFLGRDDRALRKRRRLCAAVARLRLRQRARR